jgi:hypothetical protein
VRPSFTPFGRLRAGAFTLNVACSWTAPITTVSHSSSSISSSQSHRSLPALAPVRTQRRGRPHTAVKQDCRKVTHTSLVTIRPPASSCQLRRGSQHHVAQPLSTGWVHTHHWGVDDIAASCISRVAAAACTEGGGASEGGTHSVEVQTELLPATPSSHSTPASMQLERLGASSWFVML